MLEPPFLADTTALVASLLALKYLPSKGPSEATSSTVLEACLMSFTALWMPSRASSGLIIFFQSFSTQGNRLFCCRYRLSNPI